MFVKSAVLWKGRWSRSGDWTEIQRCSVAADIERILLPTLDVAFSPNATYGGLHLDANDLHLSRGTKFRENFNALTIL